MINLTQDKWALVIDSESGFLIADLKHRESCFTDRNTVSFELFLLLRDETFILIDDRNDMILV